MNHKNVYAAWLGPYLRPITEAGIGAPHMIGRTTDGTCEQVGDALLQNRVGRQTDGVRVTFRFQELVDLRLGKCGVAPEVAPTRERPSTPE